MLIWIVLILSFVVANILVNKAQQLYMKFIGADTMFFNGKKKLIGIVVLALLISSIIIQIFGIEIPR